MRRIKGEDKTPQGVKAFLVIIILSMSFNLLASGVSEGANMQDYCIIPPYVKRDVSPNIMILMDNSKDMLKSAYIKGDADYVPGGSYEGYFENSKYYEYKTNRFEISTRINPNPGAHTQATLVVDNTILFKGDLLNWATTSRFDLLQKVLIGGKAASRQTNDHTLESVSGEWKKTYNGCRFEISGGELTIKDAAETSCPLLDTPPRAIALNARPTTFASKSPSIGSYLAYLLEFLIKNAYAKKPVKITTGRLPDGIVGVPYSATVSAVDGTLPYTWSITAGSLPPGLSLNPSTGEISGTPTTAGTYPFTVKVTDAGGGTVTRNLDIKIKPPTARFLGPMKVRIDTGGVEQKGIIQDFLGSARWGLMTFRKGMPPYVEEEIKERTTSSDIASFVTNIQNIGIVNKAPIGKGYYGILNYFRYTKKNDAWAGSPGIDPFANDTIPCRKTFVLTISSVKNIKGGSDNDMSDSSCMSTYTWYDRDGNTRTDDATNKTLIKHSCYGYKNDLRSDKSGKQNVYHYAVFTFGDPDDCTDSTADEDGIECDEISDSPRGKNKGILKASTQAGGGMQEGTVQFYDAGDTNLKDALTAAITGILKRAAAGTAASVLASGEGSGANLIQAVFYPRAMTILKGGIFSNEIDWIGRLANYWYYVDPLFAMSSIYEDQASRNTLNLTDDNKIELYFDTSTERTKARRWYDNSIPKDGVPETGRTPDIEFEKLSPIWEAGVELWKRTSPRKIKTWYDSNNNGVVEAGEFIDFSTENAHRLRPYLTPADINGDGIVNDEDASLLIQYIHGTDFSNLRSRRVAVDLNGDKDVLDEGEGPKVWKLGDVLNSTPKISSWIPLNTYHQKYSDTTYGSGTTEGFINTANYKNRGMVFVGANDGMLHAFKLGKFELTWDGQGNFEKARMTNPDGYLGGPSIPIGHEMWAFIPKNALPYLKYLADPEYCHVYTIDLPPYLFDASINRDASIGYPPNGAPDDLKRVNSWRTILIGGMRYGGACKPKNAACPANSVCAPVNVNGTSVGYSSYFALDVTDQNNPILLWEFSHPQLGFTTTGPAVVRINAIDPTTGQPNKNLNGHWYVVFGSGPTGPIDTTAQQFMGRSDQNLRLFVLNLKTGELVRMIDTGIPFAFAGSMFNVTIDTDLDYQDDVVYIPYVKRAGLSPNFTWTDGGVGRLITKEDPDPSKWAWSTVIDGIGPVTSSVANLQNQRRKELWLYFGTGRYYFEKTGEIDDANSQRQIFGVKEPCFNASGFDSNCTSSLSFTDLINVTEIANVPPSGDTIKGWYINLDLPGNYTYTEGGRDVTRDYWAERIITDPLAATTGVVFFTAYKPYSDICTYGGKSFIWAVKYDTGGAPGALLKGVALLQVSTGAIEQIDLSKAFTLADGRKSGALEGVPPTSQGLSIMTTPNPAKRIIHMRQR